MNLAEKILTSTKLPVWAAAVVQKGHVVAIFDLRDGEVWHLKDEPQIVRDGADYLFLHCTEPTKDDDDAEL